MAFTLLWTLALPAFAFAQAASSTNIPVLAGDASHQTATQPALRPPEPPPTVDPATLAPGEWLITLKGLECTPSAQVAIGWLSTVTVDTGGKTENCTQSMEGNSREAHARPAEILSSRMMFRADNITYDQLTEDMHAEGHVYFYNFVNKERLWCDKVDYHTEKGKEYGTFTGHVVGDTFPRITSKPGFLTTAAPFHFEGEWAERDETRYIVHNGWVTDCVLPKPWWRLRGKKFDIIMRDHVTAQDSMFLLHGIPVFFFPWFYHPLQREPRKSGFLMPSPFHNTLRGYGVGMGYFWAINRSYDLTYNTEVFTSGLVTQHVEARGTPKAGTYYVIDAFGSATTQLYSPAGLTAYGQAKSQLGGGWTANGTLNYTTTLLFKQDWSQSYADTVGSVIQSNAFLNKDWSTYSFDVEVSRTELFDQVEQSDPVTGKITGPADAVTISKFPEGVLMSRDHDIFKNLPLWYSFEGSAGLMSRTQPYFNSANQVIDTYQGSTALVGRINFAPHLTTAFNLGPIHFVPSIGIQETFYSDSQASTAGMAHIVGADLVRSSRDFSLDMLLPTLERVFDKKTFLGDKLKHVIEPRATYLYITGVGSDFDRFMRFDDTDIRANTSQLNLSLTNRIYAKRGDAVLEIFSWEIAQQRYFDPTFGGALVSGQRNVFESTAALTGYAFLLDPRSSSPAVSTMRLTPINGLSIQWQMDYDHRLHSVVDSAFSVDYRWKVYGISAGNNEVHNNPILEPFANQFRMRATYGKATNRGVNAYVDAIYDYQQQKLLYATSQVTYNTDCCGLSLQFRRVYRVNLPDENLYAISFSVANVGAFGTLKKQDRVF